MKFHCKHCGKIFDRDMRFKLNKDQITKRGFKSFCEVTNKDVFLKPLVRFNLKKALSKLEPIGKRRGISS